MLTALLLAAGVYAASVALVGAVRRYALAAAVLDRPGERSMHSVPTPRGGGLAIVAAVLAVTIALALAGALAGGDALGILGAVAAVAAIGWLDDRRSLPRAPRLLVQGLAALWLLAWIGVPSRLVLGDVAVPLGPFAWPLGVLAIVWLVNLYNFMDGIDGIAGLEGLAVAAGAAVLFAAGGQPGWALLCVAVAASCAGFLAWNWAPARIFMGDAGSYALGCTFAACALAGERGGAAPAAAWLLLLGVFVVDATLTLAMRAAAGTRFWVPHRDHAYQRLARIGAGHARTAAGAGLLTAIVGWPLAALVVLRPGLAPWAVAAGTLIMAASWFAVQGIWRTRRPASAPAGDRPPGAAT